MNQNHESTSPAAPAEVLPGNPAGDKTSDPFFGLTPLPRDKPPYHPHESRISFFGPIPPNPDGEEGSFLAHEPDSDVPWSVCNAKREVVWNSHSTTPEKALEECGVDVSILDDLRDPSRLEGFPEWLWRAIVHNRSEVVPLRMVGDRYAVVWLANTDETVHFPFVVLDRDSLSREKIVMSSVSLHGAATVEDFPNVQLYSDGNVPLPGDELNDGYKLVVQRVEVDNGNIRLGSAFSVPPNSYTLKRRAAHLREIPGIVVESNEGEEDSKNRGTARKLAPFPGWVLNLETEYDFEVVPVRWKGDHVVVFDKKTRKWTSFQHADGVQTLCHQCDSLSELAHRLGFDLYPDGLCPLYGDSVSCKFGADGEIFEIHANGTVAVRQYTNGQPSGVARGPLSDCKLNAGGRAADYYDECEDLIDEPLPEAKTATPPAQTYPDGTKVEIRDVVRVLAGEREHEIVAIEKNGSVTLSDNGNWYPVYLDFVRRGSLAKTATPPAKDLVLGMEPVAHSVLPERLRKCTLHDFFGPVANGRGWLVRLDSGRFTAYDLKGNTVATDLTEFDAVKAILAKAPKVATDNGTDAPAATRDVHFGMLAMLTSEMPTDLRTTWVGAVDFIFDLRDADEIGFFLLNLGELWMTIDADDLSPYSDGWCDSPREALGFPDDLEAILDRARPSALRKSAPAQIAADPDASDDTKAALEDLAKVGAEAIEAMSKARIEDFPEWARTNAEKFGWLLVRCVGEHVVFFVESQREGHRFLVQSKTARTPNRTTFATEKAAVAAIERDLATTPPIAAFLEEDIPSWLLSLRGSFARAYPTTSSTSVLLEYEGSERPIYAVARLFQTTLGEQVVRQNTKILSGWHSRWQNALAASGSDGVDLLPGAEVRDLHGLRPRYDREPAALSKLKYPRGERLWFGEIAPQTHLLRTFGESWRWVVFREDDSDSEGVRSMSWWHLTPEVAVSDAGFDPIVLSKLPRPAVQPLDAFGTAARGIRLATESEKAAARPIAEAFVAGAKAKREIEEERKALEKEKRAIEEEKAKLAAEKSLHAHNVDAVIAQAVETLRNYPLRDKLLRALVDDHTLGEILDRIQTEIEGERPPLVSADDYGNSSTVAGPEALRELAQELRNPDETFAPDAVPKIIERLADEIELELARKRQPKD